MDRDRSLKNKSRLLLGLVKSPADLTLAKFVYYYGPKNTDHATYGFFDMKNILKHHKFDREKKTAIYLHGYVEKLDDESVSIIVNAYLNRNDHNLIVLDWAKLADGNYVFDAVENSKQLGSEFAKIILSAIDDGLKIEKLHLIGHSLGGQLAGIVGREIIQRTNGSKKLPRITALDPAFPSFYIVKTARPLSKEDAHFVDIIHTDGWLYGTPFSTGTADFYPNGGKTLQPGCPRRNYKLLSDNDLCSHRRSWRFWAESVSTEGENKFHAVKAKSWKDFKAGRVEELEKEVYMGIDSPTNISGDYYLQTNGTPPFARGKAGKIYTELCNEDIFY